MKKILKIQLIKSLIGKKNTHRAIIRGLGLKRINSVRVLNDTSSVRGMINKVSYFVKILS
ncbi:50S ribosomal protein L30 [Candidatus Profftella armatura]|uniref:Large ribosomal subunit protein uL30 n=1 Tax=Candidatus Profftella armatura TaxID=669502 RepID=S5R3G8_9PROT|nr:50S ribosomal protein L30 [Candidatus Profftella armatura]ALC95863.1 50S ribosomal protein L30 [Candidatus Profftella armatura]